MKLTTTRESHSAEIEANPGSLFPFVWRIRGPSIPRDCRVMGYARTLNAAKQQVATEMNWIFKKVKKKLVWK